MKEKKENCGQSRTPTGNFHIITQIPEKHSAIHNVLTNFLMFCVRNMHRRCDSALGKPQASEGDSGVSLSMSSYINFGSMFG